jgi:hypothetical protein
MLMGIINCFPRPMFEMLFTILLYVFSNLKLAEMYLKLDTLNEL